MKYSSVLLEIACPFKDSKPLPKPISQYFSFIHTSVSLRKGLFRWGMVRLLQRCLGKHWKYFVERKQTSPLTTTEARTWRSKGQWFWWRRTSWTLLIWQLRSSIEFMSFWANVFLYSLSVPFIVTQVRLFAKFSIGYHLLLFISFTINKG